jgi:predicted N-formylglutamate amidohydrolase
MSSTAQDSRLLGASDGPAFEIVNPGGASPILLVCEHAANRVPERLANLGLEPGQLASHVGWDPGALALAERLSSAFDAQLIAARFSRLVYDCNRPPDAPSAMPHDTEVCAVPGNMDLTHAERQARVAEIYLPFHAALADLIVRKRADGKRPIVVTVHSFTPIFRGERRDVEIGFLHGRDGRLAGALRDFCAGRSTYDVRLNQPYGPTDGVLHTIEKHLGDSPFPYVMIEVRNDLLAPERGLADVVNLLSNALPEALSGSNFNETTRWPEA